MSRQLPRALRVGQDYDSSPPDPLTPSDDASYSSGDEIVPGESRSVLNGIERTLPHRQPRAIMGGELVAQSPSDGGVLKEKTSVWDDLANKMLPPEGTEYIIQQLEKRADQRLMRTYLEGMAMAEVDESAIVLNVGLTFLPGADKPMVNRIEQMNMAGKEPDQKDANWRVNTAGSLLRRFEVSADLQIVQSDQTSSIVKTARSRAKRDSRFQDQAKALSYRKSPYDAVTIDSESVKIVNDLRSGSWDVQGLLVEVDGSSLLNLMMNYRHLIARGGPDMTFQETRMLLETMIEDARRLCVRSPILFRMSTRMQIINSRNTRYGIDHGPMFRTLTTSKGIQEIISLSASYYNSLDPSGGDDATQNFIKPKFLQMIVLLLSLLNDTDLREIQEFIEATYKLKADRRNLELVFLKVIPLMSINPRVFLKALVPAIEGYPLSNDSDDGDAQSHTWNVFMKGLLQNGYLLPGKVADLGRDCLSWIVKWPDEGIKSTAVFNDLQYSGPLRTINDIPPIELDPGSTLNELTVILTDGSRYTVSSTDLEKITCLAPGAYPIQEPGEERRSFDLIVHETPINAELYAAIKMTNEIVTIHNSWLTNHKRTGSVKGRFMRRSTGGFLNECKGSGRLTENVARLGSTTLAVAYKVEGRKISRTDTIRNMAGDIRNLTLLVDHIEKRFDNAGFRISGNERSNFKQNLERAKGQIALADQSRARIGSNVEISDEPISKCLYPQRASGRESNLWHNYRAWCLESTGVLHVEAKQSVVKDITWLSDDLIELLLEGQPFRIHASPLAPVQEGLREDEVQKGDVVMLVGQYVMLGVQDESRNQSLVMTNYLRLANVDIQSSSRRGMNRAQKAEPHVCCSFR